MEKNPYFIKRQTVKRKEIIRKLAEAGFTFQEGRNHTRIYDKNGVFRAPVGRHVEIDDWIVKKIEKQTGVKLF
jgi:predicted RNA binding protein YcfA (HicA-like mRNA interferase family)